MDSLEFQLDQNLVALHQDVLRYGVAVNSAIAQALRNKHPYPFAGGALLTQSASVLAFHQAVLALCATGWAGCCAPTLRTLLDLLLNVLIIVERKEEAELRGFRCTHFFLKVTLADGQADEIARADARQQVEDGLAKLKTEDRARASAFIYQEKRLGYWYSPYYARPQAACDALFIPELASSYRSLSGAAHGGHLGLGIFRDQPDEVHPNPRHDSRSEATALGTSIRVVLEVFRARDDFELGGALNAPYTTLLARLSEFRRD